MDHPISLHNRLGMNASKEDEVEPGKDSESAQNVVVEIGEEDLDASGA